MLPCFFTYPKVGPTFISLLSTVYIWDVIGWKECDKSAINGLFYYFGGLVDDF